MSTKKKILIALFAVYAFVAFMKKSLNASWQGSLLWPLITLGLVREQAKFTGFEQPRLIPGYEKL